MVNLYAAWIGIFAGCIAGAVQGLFFHKDDWLDGHTKDIFDDVFEFVKDSGLHEVQVTILTAFPGTPLYGRLKAEGRLLEPEAWEKCTLFDLNFQPKDMTVEELTDGFRKLAVNLYSEEFTKYRRDNFKKFLHKRMSQKGD